MIEKNKIQISKSTDEFGLTTYTAEYKAVVCHKITSELLEDMKSGKFEEIEESIKELSIRHIYRDVYGDLSKDIIDLLTLAKLMHSMIDSPGRNGSLTKEYERLQSRLNFKLNVMKGR